MKILKCEVCGNYKLKPVLDLGRHPLCDDLIKIGSKKICKEYKIKILFCIKCFTAHQKYQINKKVLFNKDYHYRARFTNDVLTGMKSLVKDAEKFLYSLKNKTILDVGCNDGSLLNFFHKKGSRTIGVEPTGAFKDVSKKHLVYNNYFDKNFTSRIKKKINKIDIICFTNVFAHIENLNLLIKNIKKILNNHTLLIIENHYLGSVFKKNQFDTFYHEHPRTYSFRSFVFIAKKLGLEILSVKFTKRYGGNIRVILGNKKNKKFIKNKTFILNEKKFFKKFKYMKKNILVWKIKKLKEINHIYKKEGKIIAKAFPGRAAILIKLLKINEQHILAVFEKPNSKKIGHYVPGTKIPILSDKILFKIIKKKKTKNILNFAWHLPKEIKNYLRTNRYKGRIINVL